jgi:hypothetical protein
MGGWLMVRLGLRYSRTSAGITLKASDWQFGQTMDIPQSANLQEEAKDEIGLKSLL